MADSTDVLSAMAGLATAAIYPTGTGVLPSFGFHARIYPGWPDRSNLDRDLRQPTPVVNITFFKLEVGERNVTRFSRDWETISQSPKTLALTVDPTGKQITVSGTIATPQNVLLMINGKPYHHAVQSNDTLAGIAADLATKVNVDTPASSAGAVITIPDAYRVMGRVGTSGKMMRELRRQEARFMATVWAHDPKVRSDASKILDIALSTPAFMSMPDGSKARIIYERSADDDAPQKELLYRRDLVFCVEYATVEIADAYEIVVIPLNITGGQGSDGPIRTTNV